MSTEKATITNLSAELAEELHKDGYCIYATDEGTFEIEKLTYKKKKEGKFNGKPSKLCKFPRR